MSSVDSIVNNGAYIITNLDDNPYGKNYTSILYVTKTMEGNSPYIRQVAVRNQYGVDSCKIRWYWGDSWTAWKDNAIDYPTFYKSYSDLSSLATALGGYVLACKRVSYSNFDSIDDVLGDYFIILGDPPASWGSPLPYGSLISFSFSDYCFQIVFPHKEYYSDGIKYRMNNGSGWGEWKTIVLT